jgi:putative spermidine/putrescine transport system substrate-binding protein
MAGFPKTSQQSATTKPAGLSRRSLLKGTAASAGLVAGTAVLGGFPTIWARDKDLTVRVLGALFG